MRWLRRLATPALACLLAAGPVLADEPSRLNLEPAPWTGGPVVSLNQQRADAVARRLQASGLLREYHIDITCAGDTVELTGTVGDAFQCDEAARLAQGVPGINRVLNRLQVPQPPFQPGAVARTQLDEQPEPVPPPTRLEGTLPPEPLPSFRFAPPGGIYSQPPPMPPYAWPTYAPFNNYSRVAYPIAYPYEAFPFIGPPYPFPRVPLGWRHVKLHWDDGHWWLSTHAQKHDWWVLRYW
jgi:hypothetical protein